MLAVTVPLHLNLQESHAAGVAEPRMPTWKSKSVHWGCFQLFLAKLHINYEVSASPSGELARLTPWGEYLLVGYLHGLSPYLPGILAHFCVPYLRNICHVVCIYLFTCVFSHPLTTSPWKTGLFHNHFCISIDIYNVWFTQIIFWHISY